MTDLRETLLKFHSAHTPDELKHDTAYDEFCRANEHKDEFGRECRLIAGINGDFAASLRSAYGTTGQVIAGVVTATAFARQDAKLDVLWEIVSRRYEATWKAEQLAYFSKAVDKLRTWRDYFLSFTNWNPRAPGAISLVNLRHQILIGTGGGLLVKHPDAVEHNLLAQSLYNWLDNELHGFFWEKHQEPAEVVTDRLRRAASQAFVFVQILQNTLFTREPKVNYCLLEYETANVDPSRVLVIWAEPADGLIKPGALRFPEFEDWYKGLVERTRIELVPVETPQTAIAELERIVAIVRDQLQQAHKRLASSVPA